ncbi:MULTISPECIES: TonB family protein [Brevundimonas]|uniref:TonB family protein n=1 Tax=Brevundimonas sp. 357 TaxID=2555782 RepID=UPI000F774D06|nr:MULTISPECIES: TonB family protein [Brevundimonas]RSB42440.1 TonB family protein [Brevundimonas sp. 357]
MMMRIAGGHGVVSPLDFQQRKKPLPRWVWAMIGASALAHVGAGVWLYQQRFERADIPPAPAETPPTVIDLIRPPLPPKPETPPKASPAPTPPIHRPAQVMPSNVAPLEVPVAPVVSHDAGPAINLTEPAAEPSTGTKVTPEPPKPVPVITQPDWVRKPTADQLMRAYPSAAEARGIGGVAELSCLVRVDGSLTGCSVTSETPGNQGFGRAAVSLSRYFRLSPRTVDGQAVDGARVTMAIRFDLPKD